MRISGLAVLFTLLAGPAGAVTCLKVRDIQSAVSADGKVLVVTMRDGTVWNNTLRGGCPGLVFNGFVWTVPSTGEVCEDSQTLRVLQSRELCRLGKFVRMSARPVKR